MIKKLNFNDAAILGEFLRIEKMSYATEARLIGFAGLPPLNDDAENLKQSDDYFFGYFAQNKLFGAMSWTRSTTELEITRLFVAPNSFRNGVGSRLLEFALSQAAATFQLKVSTAAKNIPAVKLYEKFGLQKVSRKSVETGLELVEFRKYFDAPA